MLVSTYLALDCKNIFAKSREYICESPEFVLPLQAQKYNK